MTQTQPTKTVRVHCTWTNEQEIEVPADWDGSNLLEFVDQVDANGVDLYDMEIS